MLRGEEGEGIDVLKGDSSIYTADGSDLRIASIGHHPKTLGFYVNPINHLLFVTATRKSDRPVDVQVTIESIDGPGTAHETLTFKFVPLPKKVTAFKVNERGDFKLTNPNPEQLLFQPCDGYGRSFSLRPHQTFRRHTKRRDACIFEYANLYRGSGVLVGRKTLHFKYQKP